MGKTIIKSRKHTIILALFIIISALGFLFFYKFLMNRPDDKYTSAITLGGEWFLNNQDDNFLYYEYDISTRTHSDVHHPLRESGSLWSIAKLANYTEDPRYDSLVQKGFTYFEQHFEYDEQNDFYYVNITPDNKKLGYSAFMILTLLETDHPQKNFYLEKFANGILYQQKDDGSLATRFYSDSNASVDYYPGEALFALMSLYEYDRNPEYLEAVEQAFPHYSDYWDSNSNTAFAPWQTRAYQKLYNETERSVYAEFVFDMNDFVVDQYKTDVACTAFDFSAGSVVAVHMEGVNKAYELAEDLSDSDRINCYGNFIQNASNYIISLQVTDTDKFEKKAIGGFLGSTTSTTTRVDRNQHAIITLIEAQELGLLD